MNCATAMRLNAFVAFVFAAAIANADLKHDAEFILKGGNVTGGFVVHLGAGTGELKAALQTSPAVQLHGLEADATKVEAARKAIWAAGKYGIAGSTRCASMY